MDGFRDAKHDRGVRSAFEQPEEARPIPFDRNPRSLSQDTEADSEANSQEVRHGFVNAQNERNQENTPGASFGEPDVKNVVKAP